MAMFTVETIESDHRVVDSTPIEGGYRLACCCDWLSPVCESGLDLFDEWAVHCVETSAA
jgi:hypothetical protein